MFQKIKSVNVFASIAGEEIRCEIIGCWQNRLTQRCYVVVHHPIKNVDDIVIPVVFEPDKEKQFAITIVEEQDKNVVEERINKNNCTINYQINNDIKLEIIISYLSDSEFSEKKQRDLQNQRTILPDNIDEALKNIDIRIIMLSAEEYFNAVKHNNNNLSEIIVGFIMNLIEQDVLFSNYPENVVEQLLSRSKITISSNDSHLVKVFQELVHVFSKQEIIIEDVENSLVALLENDTCSKEMYNAVVNHKTFSKFFSGDGLRKIRNHVILRIPSFFDEKEIKTAANYFYSKKQYEASVKLFEMQLNILSLNNGKEKDIADSLNSIGCCYVSIMYFGEAYIAFKRATELDNSYAVAFNNWAYTIAVECDTLPKDELRKNKLYDAITYVTDAIQLNGKDVSYVSNKAFIEFELGQYEQVIREYNRAKAITLKYSDLSTIIKLKIDSQVKLYIQSPNQYPLNFSELYDSLNEIFANETGSARYYFEALEVYNEITKYEEQTTVEKISFELVLLEFYINQLMSEIAIRNPSQDIYYYTSMSSLQRLLNDENAAIKYRLPVFNSCHMNDPSEGQELYRTFPKYVAACSFTDDLFSKPPYDLKTSRQQLETDFVFLKAFTKNDDSLPMWVHYADSGKGCCVKVNARFFTNFDNDSSDNEKTLESNPFDNAYRLYDVLYLHDGKIKNKVSSEAITSFDNMFKQISNISGYYDSLSDSSKKHVVSAVSIMIGKLKYLFKTSDYIYEEEMRIVLRRSMKDFQRDDIDVQMTSTTIDAPIPKVFIYTGKSISIDEIILGPKVSETDTILPFLTMKLLRLNDYHSDKINITKSIIEYR